MLTLRRFSPSLRRSITSSAAACQSLSLAAVALHRHAQLPSPRKQISSFLRRPLSTTPRILSQNAEASEQVGSPDVESPVTRFEQLRERKMVDDVLVNTLTQKMRFETMTDVQSLTINESLKGVDVLAQAKTGTGKTIGFLLPVMQRILESDPSLRERKRRAYGKVDDIRAIIISPTRELAEQIGEEARKLADGTGMIIQIAVGGTQKRMHLRQMQSQGCHILIGTPGRLKDILSDEYSGISAPNLEAFVLDEADRLLDQGFWPEIQEIMKLLPDRRVKDRQTLMFSATIPREVVGLVRATMKPDLHFVRTVSEQDVPTHERVLQNVVVVKSIENMLPTVLELCQREIAAAAQSGGSPFKAIIYFNATAEVSMAATIFNELRESHLRGIRTYYISSRLAQASRTHAADSFRAAPSGILFSSDVTARGMDFPNVTHVIQCGLPQERDAYIHRVGRTGRAGKEGQGWVFFARFCEAEARERLHDLPLQRNETLQTASADFSPDAPTAPSPLAASTFAAVRTASRAVARGDKGKVYLAMLGIFQWLRNKPALVEHMNNLAARQWGMATPPPISRSLASRLGLISVPGVNIGYDDDERSDRRSSYGRGFGGGGGGFGGGREFDRGFGGSSGSGSGSGFDFGSDRDFSADGRSGYARGRRGDDAGFERRSFQGRGAGRGGYGSDRGDRSGGYRSGRDDRGGGGGGYGGERRDRGSGGVDD